MDTPSTPDRRASDADRDRTVSALRAAVVEGRLTLEEFGDRVGAAHAARTEGELAALTRDLPAPPPAPAAAQQTHRAICSRLVRKGPLQLPPRSSYRSLFGTIDLDLRQATIEAPEVELEIRNTFGTVTVLVPDAVAVEVDGGAPLASLHLDTSTSSPPPGAPVIRIRARGVGGTLYVRTREPRRLIDRLLGP